MWSEAARAASIAARRAASSASSAIQHVGQAAHQTRLVQALEKDRFTHAVPPGSLRDYAVKKAAQFSEFGILKNAARAATGPIGLGVLAAGSTAYSAAKLWKMYSDAKKVV